MQQKFSLTIRTLFPQLLFALASLSFLKILKCFVTIFRVIALPYRYSCYHQKLSLPFHLLILSFVFSLLKFSLDPNVIVTLNWLGLPRFLLPFSVIASAFGSIVGAFLIPIFWYRALGIKIDRDLFVTAMIQSYAAVVIPVDAISVFWMPLITSGDIAFWIPDAFKTVVVTIYCWIVGNQLPLIDINELD